SPIYTLSLHDALPISAEPPRPERDGVHPGPGEPDGGAALPVPAGGVQPGGDRPGGRPAAVERRGAGVLQLLLLRRALKPGFWLRSEEHTSELQSRSDL